MQYATVLFHLNTHADEHAHKNTREWGSNEARGDTAELSVNPQLADTQPTTSMTRTVEACRTASDEKRSPGYNGPGLKKVENKNGAANLMCATLWETFRVFASKRFFVVIIMI